MELMQLYYFMTVAKMEHFTNASKKLHITQPSLSKTISRLEEDLGVKLFDREGNHVKLNAYGKSFLRHVELIFKEIADAKRELDDISNSDTGTISIANSLPEIFEDYIRVFLTENPKIHFHQFHLPHYQVLDALQSGEIDMAITCFDISSERVKWKPLFIDDIGIIVSKNHPLASRDSVKLSDLSEENFILVNTTKDMRVSSLDFCTKAGFNPKVYFEGNLPGIVVELVSNGFGVSFASKRRAHANEAEGKTYVKYLDIEEPICKRITGIATLRDTYLPAAVRKFYLYLINQFPPLAIQ
jgi:DNA-binding transcriptional LysR family regulator